MSGYELIKQSIEISKKIRDLINSIIGKKTDGIL